MSSRPRESTRVPVDPGIQAAPSPPTFAGVHAVGAATRHEAIRKLAYLRAERRGFESGAELDDWLAAEREIDRER